MDDHTSELLELKGRIAGLSEALGAFNAAHEALGVLPEPAAPATAEEAIAQMNEAVTLTRRTNEAIVLRLQVSMRDVVRRFEALKSEVSPGQSFERH